MSCVTEASSHAHLLERTGESRIGILPNERSHDGRVSNPALAVCACCAWCVCRTASGHLPSTDREKGHEIGALDRRGPSPLWVGGDRISPASEQLMSDGPTYLHQVRRSAKDVTAETKRIRCEHLLSFLGFSCFAWYRV